jgi:hypothetical protein
MFSELEFCFVYHLAKVQGPQEVDYTEDHKLLLASPAGLPDCSWHMIPKPEKCTK